jgi:predicted alpha/beta superfamily hydrolase
MSHLIVLIMLMICPFLSGQESFAPPLTYPVAHYETIYSNILKEDRTIIVHLPDDYKARSKYYPLLFILDAEDTSRFIQSVLANEFYSAVRRIPKMIIIGLLNTDRSRDMTPRKVAQRNSSGGGDLFLDFIVSELQPYIEGKYRNAPYRILFGGSSAGMFTLYTLFNRPESFDAYIASRPALNSLVDYTWESEIIFKSVTRLFRERSSLRKFLYIDYGGQEDALHDPQPIHQLVSIFKLAAPPDFIWEIRKTGESGYRSAESLNDGLITLFGNWHYAADSLYKNGFKGLEIHADMMSERFGYPVTVADLLAERDFLIFGHRFLENGDFDEAIRLFKYAVTVLSDSWILYDRLGDAYFQIGQKNLAIESYTKSLELNPKNENAANFINQHRN